MKILIYGVNYVPELTGIGKYTGKMGEWLAEQGHDTRVVSASLCYPEWQVSKGYRNTYQKEKNKVVFLADARLVERKQIDKLLHAFSISERWEKVCTLLVSRGWRIDDLFTKLNQ